MTNSFKVTYVTEILYIPAAGLIVISVLLAHRRTRLAKQERLLHKLLGLVTAGWTISFAIIWIVQLLVLEITGKETLDPFDLDVAKAVTEAILLLSTLALSYRAVPQNLSRRWKRVVTWTSAFIV